MRQAGSAFTACLPSAFGATTERAAFLELAPVWTLEMGRQGLRQTEDAIIS